MRVQDFQRAVRQRPSRLRAEYVEGILGLRRMDLLKKRQKSGVAEWMSRMEMRLGAIQSLPHWERALAERRHRQVYGVASTPHLDARWLASQTDRDLAPHRNPALSELNDPNYGPTAQFLLDWDHDSLAVSARKLNAWADPNARGRRGRVAYEVMLDWALKVPPSFAEYIRQSESNPTDFGIGPALEL